MAAIDPAVVGGFVREVGAARDLGIGAMDALAPITAGGAGDARAVTEAASYVRSMDSSLDDALRSTTTRAAADAVAGVRTLELPGIAHALDELRASIDAAGTSTDPAEVVRRAHDVQVRLRTVVEHRLESAVDKATTPLASEDATLGSAGADGAWRSDVDALGSSIDEFAAGTGIELDHSQLFEEVDDVLRAADDHAHEGGSAGSAFDEDIAVADLEELLRSEDAAARFAGAAPGTRATIEGAAAELRSTVPLDPHEGGVLPRFTPGTPSGPRVTMSGREEPMGAPADGDLVAVAQYQRSAADNGVELPLVMAGEAIRVPTRDHALDLARRASDGSWYLVAPHVDGGWQLLHVQSAGSNADAVHDLVRSGGRLVGLRQELGRVDAVSRGGDVVLGAAPQASVDELVASAMARDTQLARVRMAYHGEVPAQLRDDAPIADLRIPGGIVSGARTVTMTARTGGGVHLVDGDRQAALDALGSVARDGRNGSVQALVRLDLGRYAVVPVGSDEAGTLATRRLRDALTADSVAAQYAPDVEAIAVGTGRGARVLDVRGGSVT